MRALDRVVLLQNLTYRAAQPNSLINICFDLGLEVKSDESLTIGVEIGKGAFGTVFAISTKEPSTKKLAFKEALPNTSLDSLRREVSLFHYRHDNIIRIEGCFHINQQCGILMERGDEDLFAVIERGQLDDECLYAYTMDILNGVGFLHNLVPNPIYHLDLKPENIMVCGNMLKICDFGLAHCDSWKTKSGQPFGSLHPKKHDLFFGSEMYLPKRELAITPNFLRKRDQWAIGCILFMMAYRVMLYDKVSSTHYTRLEQKLTAKDEQTYFSELCRMQPRGVETILGKLISYDPEPIADILHFVKQRH
jgi:serine/threonine protein kinase